MPNQHRTPTSDADVSLSISKDWGKIRQALKHDGATVHTNGARYWLVVPLDANIARQILSHPAVLPAPAGDYRIGDANYQTFRWRWFSPAKQVFERMRRKRSLQ
jgi:hypothetical protein